MSESERNIAVKIANRWLNKPNEDPDCVAAVIARQYLRALEKIGRLTKIAATIDACACDPVVIVRPAGLKEELQDHWPMVISVPGDL